MTRAGLVPIALILLAIAGNAQQTPEDEVYRVGDGFNPPILQHKIETAYSSAATNEHLQGTVLLQIVIDKQGVPQNIEILSPLGLGLDQNAIEAVAQWRFLPGLKDGHPVQVRATVEVSLVLLGNGFDSGAEARRTKYNEIVSRLAKTANAKPSAKDQKEMQDLAKHKLPSAVFMLGLWSVTGDSGIKDVAGGLAQIQNAAKMGCPAALWYLGHAKMAGELVAKDEVEGLKLLRHASDLGDRDAQFTLGMLYTNGSGVHADQNRAKTYWRLCAAAGTPVCQYNLGRLLLQSAAHKENDRLQAIAWFELAEAQQLREAHDVVVSERAKLTPEQARSVNRLRNQLEHKD